MFFEILLVFILFKFKKRPQHFRNSIVYKNILNETVCLRHSFTQRHKNFQDSYLNGIYVA